MPLPGDIATITVTGTYRDGAGYPLTGNVTFTPSTDLLDSTGHVVLRAAPLIANLTSCMFSIVLPCTDNATLAPTSWAYNVVENITDGTSALMARTYTVQLPHTLGTTVDITNVAPVNPSTPYSPYYGVLGASNTWTGTLNAFGGEVTVQIPTNPADAATKAYADTKLAIAQNLADLANAGTARTNLGLGTAAVANIGTASGTAAAGNDSRITGAVQASTVTTKGDLLAATGNASIARLGAGSDGQVLTAASGQTSGLTWATPSAGADPNTAKLGLVAQPFPVEAVNNIGLGLTAGFLILALIRPGAVTINSLGLWLGGQGSGSSGVNSMALFSEAGVQLAVTGDMTSALTNAANAGLYVEAAVGTPYTTTAATSYYVGVLCQMSSNPTIAGSYSGGLHIPTIKTHRPAIVVGSQSSMPASFSVSGATTASAAYWLVAS